MPRRDVTLIDVRTKDEYAAGTIDGAINIPLDDMRSSLDLIPADKPIVLFCAVGLRGYLASNILRQRGFNNVRNLIGGLKTYRVATAKVAERSCSSPQTMPVDRASDNQHPTTTVDACGLSCPGPIMKLKQAIESSGENTRVSIMATDPGFARDARAWCESTGNRFISHESDKGIHTIVVEKSGTKPAALQPGGRGKTFIMFSDDLDKALATFVLANGAAATGQKVTIFFTFGA